MGFIELEPCILLRICVKDICTWMFKVERGHTKSYGQPTQMPKNKVKGEGRWTKNVHAREKK